MSIDIWHVITPQDGTNLVTNPSFEVGTSGWATTSATLTRTAGAGVFGSYGGRMLASALNGKIGFTAAAVASGSANTLSMWVKADSASVSLKGTIGATTASQSHPGDGTWRRLEVPITAPSATTPVLEIIDGRAAAWTSVDTDGAQVETGVSVATTYIDGDQDGSSWLGAAHNSISTRDARDGRGGAITSFLTAGLYVTEMPGIGVPDVDVATTPFAISDGSSWTRSTVRERVLTLIGKILGPGTTTGLHATRRTVMSAFSSVFNARGPVVLRYTGAAETKRLTAHYEQGFGWDRIDGADEVLPLRFRAPDPFWYAETDASAALDPNNTVTGINNFLLRDRSGIWSNMAGGQSTPASGNPIGFATGPDGFLYAWGSFQGAFSGATRSYLTRWNGTAWVDAISGGADPNGEVTALAFNPAGGYVIGGNFTLIGANTRTRIASVNASLVDSAMSTGANSNVDGLAYDQSGGLWVTGAFTTIGGVAATRGAYWNGSAFLATAAAAERLSYLQLGPDGLMYGAGAGGVYYYLGAWVSLGTVPSGAIFDMQWRPEGLYIFGSFTSIAGVAAAGAARYRGGAWEAIATTTTGSSPEIRGHFGPDGVFHGTTTAASIDGSIMPAATPQPVSCRWDGSTWSADDVILPVTAAQQNAFPQRDGSIAYGMQVTGGSAVVPGLTTVTNGGTADAYPVVTIDTGQGYVISLVNLTTGKSIRFNNLIKFGGEYVTIDLRPGRKTVTSNYRQLIGTVLPGSDLDTWALAPGANTIQMFCDTLVTGATIYWRQRYWGAD